MTGEDSEIKVRLLHTRLRIVRIRELPATLETIEEPHASYAALCEIDTECEGAEDRQDRAAYAAYEVADQVVGVLMYLA